MNWPRYFFNIARAVSGKSRDTSTKVGCVLANEENEVLSVGFNGFPMGVQDLEERYSNRSLKYKYVCHAEANAIAIAAKNGMKLNGARLFISFMPCSNCAKLLIQAGIKEINIDGESRESNDEELMKRWEEDFNFSTTMFDEAGVKLILHRND